MGVDVNRANGQAAQLKQYAEQLRAAKKNLQKYKTEITLNWVGKETAYIHTGIDQSIAQIDAVISQLETIQGDIVNTATQIRQEEIAREEAERQARLVAAAAAAEAARVAAAQAAAQAAAMAATQASSGGAKASSSSSNISTPKPNSFLGWISSWF